MVPQRFDAIITACVLDRNPIRAAKAIRLAKSQPKGGCAKMAKKLVPKLAPFWKGISAFGFRRARLINVGWKRDQSHRPA